MNNQEARNRILKAAQSEFAEKGFDGARTDSIARKAGVNKALIYYYFKGKDHLFSTLVEDFFTEMKKFLEQVIGGLNLVQTDSLDAAFEAIFAFLEAREDLIRLVFTESLKKGSDDMALFEFVSMCIGEDRDSLADLMVAAASDIRKDLSLEEIRVTEFYTLFGPVILYLLLRGKWEAFFTVDRETLKKQFIAAISRTHVSYHHGKE
ncbi:MAG: TetR/AcrR family transcriptional regulator [Spirochaetales bacterium]|nr:TetR/AcrR family transcriptional regulator [Spirochaetales bacterium]